MTRLRDIYRKQSKSGVAKTRVRDKKKPGRPKSNPLSKVKYPKLKGGY